MRRISVFDLAAFDPAVAAAIHDEERRQRDNIELIASENYTSAAVMTAVGSVLTNKYAEGYPGRRYYGGCEYVDVVETLAIDRAKQLFGAEHANVQPHAGAQANFATFFALLEPGDRILSQSLANGGHLSHGLPVNVSGKWFTVQHYDLEPGTDLIDYDALEKQAEEFRPKMIIAGFSAYSRYLDFARFRAIADSVGALLMADIAHVAGLVVAGEYPSPIGFAHVTTTTTHKTLRGPRGGLILCNEEHAKAIDKAVLPGIQGGPLMHVIAGKAVAFGEALRPEFKQYAIDVVANARRLAAALQERGMHIVSGGTDNHLMLVDLAKSGIDMSGRTAEKVLDSVAITVNKNTVPGETRSAMQASGIRLGTPAITTRGMGLPEMDEVADLIVTTLRNTDDPSALSGVRERVRTLCQGFSVPADMLKVGASVAD
jgi:glycine hydroxymethyltransferase